MKTHLHKTPEGFVLTSDEEIQEGDLYWCNQKGKGIDVGYGQPSQALVISEKRIDMFTCEHCIKILVQQPQLDFSDLKPEEHKEIGLFTQIIRNSAFEYATNHEDSKNCGHKVLMSYIAGFQKCQELMGQIFTSEDMIKAVEMAQTTDEQMNYPKSDEIIQFLSHKSWEVEIKKEYLSNNGEWKDVLLPSEWEINTQIRPKLTKEGKIKILRLI